MTFDEWFDREGYDEQHRFVFGLAWNAGLAAAGETGIDVDSPVRKDAERYRKLRAGNYSIALERSILNDTPLGVDAAVDALPAVG